MTGPRVDAAVLAAFAGTPTSVVVAGPRRFLRAAGADNNPYGRWWVEAAVLLDLQSQFDRIPLPPGHRREAILGQLRAATAISVDWNTLSEFWFMEVPSGHSVQALMGPAKEQPVFSLAHKLHNTNLVLRGGIPQFYFPVINPLWVSRFGSYFDV
jgi:hypothetical protein